MKSDRAIPENFSRENKLRFKDYSVEQTPIERQTDVKDYFYKLIQVKLGLLRKYGPYKKVLDVGCGCGDYLFLIKDLIKETGLGIDFSESAIAQAKEIARQKECRYLEFICQDAARLNMPDANFDLVYSFSTLYAVSKVEILIGEMLRVLKKGGIAVLDMGNARSLNVVVARVQKNAPLLDPLTYGQIKEMLQKESAQVIEWRSFQILPYWGRDPWWLRPLLWPRLKHFFSQDINGKMIDERISSVFRMFAFRHIIVCRKI